MMFNFFGSKKDDNTDVTQKKLKSVVITPFTEKDAKTFKTDDGIDIVIGDTLKKSKYSFEISEQESTN